MNGDTAHLTRGISDVIERYAAERDGWTSVTDRLPNGMPRTYFLAADMDKQAAMLRLNSGGH